MKTTIHFAKILLIPLILASSLFFSFKPDDSGKTQQRIKLPLTQEEENKIEQLISSLSLEEKVNMLHSSSLFTSAGVERLGIAELHMMTVRTASVKK